MSFFSFTNFFLICIICSSCFSFKAPMYYRKANAAMLVYDITSEDSFYDIKDWVSGRFDIEGESISPPSLSLSLHGTLVIQLYISCDGIESVYCQLVSSLYINIYNVQCTTQNWLERNFWMGYKEVISQYLSFFNKKRI